VFEFACGENLEASIPYLDTFTKNIGKVHLDPAVRPVAKVCEYLVKAYYSRKDNEIKSALTLEHQEQIIEACFDWMINDEKIAPKAYSMNSLYLNAISKCKVQGLKQEQDRLLLKLKKPKNNNQNLQFHTSSF